MHLIWIRLTFCCLLKGQYTYIYMRVSLQLTSLRLQCLHDFQYLYEAGVHRNSIIAVTQVRLQHSLETAYVGKKIIAKLEKKINAEQIMRNA